MPIQMFAPFFDYWLERELERHAKRTEDHIRSLQPDVVLGKTQDVFVAEVLRDWKPKPPRLDLEAATTSKVTRYVPNRWLHGAQSSTQIFVVRIPFTGDFHFLRCYARDRPIVADLQEFFLDDGALCFESWPDAGDRGKLERETHEHFEFVRRRFPPLVATAERFIATFDARVRNTVESARLHAMKPP